MKNDDKNNNQKENDNFGIDGKIEKNIFSSSNNDKSLTLNSL